MTETYSLWALILSGVLALFLFSFAYQKHFFALPKELIRENLVRFDHVFVICFIYFASILFFPPLIYKAIQNHAPYLSPSSEVTWLNFLLFSLVLVLFFLYFCLMDKKVLRNVFKRKFSNEKSILYDFSIGFLTLFLAYPLSQFFSLFVEFVLLFVYNIQKIPDQSAVEFLKSVLNEPLNLILAVVSITLLAPLLEEILFRGFILSFLKKYIGRASAIIISSLIFAAVHFRADQQLANIHILIVLFTLGLLLGFVYERQKSLYAPISLHICFNTINVVNLLLFKDQSLL